MNTGHLGTSTNANTYPQNAANIPLPPGTPPPHHNQLQQQQQHHQQQQQLQDQQQLQQQQRQHQYQQHMLHQRQLFGGVTQPVTFESIARKNETNHPNSLFASTLQQYGPAMGSAVNSSTGHHAIFPGMLRPMTPNLTLPPQQQQHSLQRMPSFQQQQQPNSLYQQQYSIQTPGVMLNHTTTVIKPPQPPTYNISLDQSTVSSAHRLNQLPTYHIATTTTPSVNQNSSFVNRSGANINVNLIDHNATTSISSTSSSRPNSSARADESGTQPPTAISPPLDALNTQQNDLYVQDRAVPESSCGQISPPSRMNILADVRERCETMSMNQMLEEYRCLKEKLEDSQRRRSTLETEINDIIRNAPDQNLELNPAFKRKKGQKEEAANRCKDVNDAIKFVAAKLEKKFSHRVQDHEVKQPLQTRKVQRVKMSTASLSPSMSKPNNEKQDEKIMLSIEDGDLWCKYCDIHFNSLKEFCDHLHKRDHMLNMDKITPWREEGRPPPQLDKSKSYGKYKTICNIVTGKTKEQITISELDRILNPTIKDHEQIKKMLFTRERREFDKDDRLFKMKGYEYLIPIQGFYCKICDVTVCDYVDAERHIKSYKHLYEHTKTIAYNREHERKFNIDKERSVQVLREQERRRNHHKSSSNSNSGGGSNKDKESATSRSGINGSSRPCSTSPNVLASTSSKRPAPTSLKASAPTTFTSCSTTTSKSITSLLPSSSSTPASDQTLAAASAPTSTTNCPSLNNSIPALQNPTQWSARLPYKKPTSKIVDEHDVIADKFDKRETTNKDDNNCIRPARPPTTQPISSTSVLSSKSSLHRSPTKNKSELRKKRAMPEIVPISISNQSAALKRLRTDRSSEIVSMISDKHSKERESEIKDHDPKNKAPGDGGGARLGGSGEEESNGADYMIHIDSSTEDEAESKGSGGHGGVTRDTKMDNEAETIGEVHLEMGDPTSPFPSLKLVVTGNTSVEALLDKRLKQEPRIVLNRIDLNDYAELLMPESTLWSRVGFLMTKKEFDTKDLEGVTYTEPSYFQADGEALPVRLDNSDSELSISPDPTSLDNFFCET